MSETVESVSSAVVLIRHAFSEFMTEESWNVMFEIVTSDFTLPIERP